MGPDQPTRRAFGPGRRSKATFAERRAARAAVDDPAMVLGAAARFLEARARSVAEVRRRLVDAGYRVELAEDAIKRLVDLGMLDDEAFARAWIESRDRARPRGARVLRDELRRKGIERTTVDAVLAERDGLAGDADAPGHDLAEVGPAREDGPTFGQLRPRPGSGLQEGESADDVAARRLLRRHAAALDRVADPRKRRQRAYALLARNGFAPDLIASLVRELGTALPDEDAGDPGDDALGSG